jgi:hypothetical protein
MNERSDRKLSVRDMNNIEIRQETLYQGELRFRDYTGDSLSGR